MHVPCSCHARRAVANAVVLAFILAEPLQASEPAAAFVPRGREIRSVELPEPELYRGIQLVISDSSGCQYIAQRCPTALANLDSSACRIVRRGCSLSKHNVVSLGFPVYLSGVVQLHCQRHNRHFNMLHPLVHEALPSSVTVQPELVVLTEDLVALREGYESLAIQVHSYSSLFGTCVSMSWLP